MKYFFLGFIVLALSVALLLQDKGQPITTEEFLGTVAEANELLNTISMCHGYYEYIDDRTGVVDFTNHSGKILLLTKDYFDEHSIPVEGNFEELYYKNVANVEENMPVLGEDVFNALAEECKTLNEALTVSLDKDKNL